MSGGQVLKIIFLALAVSACLFPSQAQTSWTVCPQGPPWCFSNSIQQAINAAAPGDTVFIQPGFYQESLLIQKSLTVQGADPQQVILQGARTGWPVITVVTTEPTDIMGLLFGGGPQIQVTLQSLQLQRAPWAGQDTQCADFGANICPNGLAVKGKVTLTASDLWVHDNGNDGINLGLHPQATIQNSYIWNNYDDGVHAWLSVELTLLGNVITGNGDNGVELQSRYQALSWLTVTGRVRATIISNQILNNKGYGIEAQTGKEVVSCYGNVIQGNGKGPLSPEAWGRCS